MQMTSKKIQFTHCLSVPGTVPNGEMDTLDSDSSEFFTPNSTPEPTLKFTKSRFGSDSNQLEPSRPSNLFLLGQDSAFPGIVTQSPSPSVEVTQANLAFPSKAQSVDTVLSMDRPERSATPDSFRKLKHPSETPIRSSGAPIELSRSCENIKSATLGRRSMLVRHQTKETSHVDVCDSEEEYQVNQYVIKEDIGKGAYGQVKKVFDKQTQEVKAMKIISKKILKRKAFQRRGFSKGGRSFQNSADEDQGIRKEIAVQKKLDHPCIVRLFEVLDDESKNEMYLVLEYLMRGTVMEVGKSGPIAEEKCHAYFVDMLLGVEYLHYQNIIHRDIKPENLLLDDHGRLKIADFGESDDLSSDHHGDQSSHKNVGTPAFYAPELIIASSHVTKAIDVWAMGVTLFCLLYDQLPFKGNSKPELYSAIQTQEITFPPEINVSADVTDLMTQLMDKSADSRITLDGVRNHAWTQRAGPLVSKEENCSEYIEVTEEEVNGAIRSCTTMFSALVIVKMILLKKSFRVPLLSKNLRERSSTTACDTDDTQESAPISNLTNQMSSLMDPKPSARSLQRQPSIDLPLKESHTSTEL